MSIHYDSHEMSRFTFIEKKKKKIERCLLQILLGVLRLFLVLVGIVSVRQLQCVPRRHVFGAKIKKTIFFVAPIILQPKSLYYSILVLL